MNRNLVGSFGFVLILLALAIPFLGLEQSDGDILPLLVAVVSFVTGLGLLLASIKPGIGKAYAISAGAFAAVAGVLLVVGFVVSF